VSRDRENCGGTGQEGAARGVVAGIVDAITRH